MSFKTAWTIRLIQKEREGLKDTGGKHKLIKYLKDRERKRKKEERNEGGREAQKKEGMEGRKKAKTE